MFKFLLTPNIQKMKKNNDAEGLKKALYYRKNSAIRAGAALCLGELKDTDCRQELYACLNDEDESVRVAASEALSGIDKGVFTRSKAKTRREMRVFISSTFRDMQKERDILIRKVFPKIRQLCRQKGVGFTEVDLRWGITEQQAERGEILPVCMAEIENSRPYFIGLLGERYGWVPRKIDPELLKEQPWLQEHQEASITALEILHGALNNPALMRRSFFYFRNPAYIDTLPLSERVDFISEDEQSRNKLEILKDRIRTSGLPVVENYAAPTTLDELVMNSLQKAVDEDYPTISMDPLDQEALSHESFAENRRKIYIRQPEVFEYISRHIRNSRNPLVITGESGVGKSALLANWTDEYQDNNPGAFVLMHFIGATSQSTSSIAILKRIMGELKRRCSIDREIPVYADNIKAEFPDWLKLAAEKGKEIVLVLDGLNQLDDCNNATRLQWLPDALPPGILLILSTVPGRSLEAAQKRGWEICTAKGLDAGERKRLIYSYLAQYRKRLSNHHVDRLVASKQTENPLFLKAILDELRIFGVHEKLYERIEYYIHAETPETLYQKILERLEGDFDYSDGRKGLSRDAMTLIWTARDGLNEDEILTLLGQNGELLPRAVWSPLFLSIQDSLINRAGILTFFHSYLKSAVGQRYLPEPNDRKAAHGRLGEFFASLPADDRVIRELLWQWYVAEDWGKLARTLADLSLFTKAWRYNEYEVKTYWTAVEANSTCKAAEAYQVVLEQPEEHLAEAREVGNLLADIGHVRESMILREFLVDHYRATGQHALLVGGLNDLAVLLQRRGDITGAILLMQEAELYCHDGLASIENQIATASNKAAFMKEEGNQSGALELWTQVADLCRKKKYNNELQAIQNNMANVLFAQGHWQAALELYRQNEQICRDSGNQGGLVNALIGQANVLGSGARFEKAFALNGKAEQLAREIGDQHALLSILSNGAILLRNLRQFDEALLLASEQEQISRELSDSKGMASALATQGVLYQDKGSLDQALTKFREAEQICRHIKDLEVLHSAIGNQATIMRKAGRLKEAMNLQKEVEHICRTLDDRRALQTSLGNQANILFDMGDIEGGIKLNRQKVAICREIGFISGLVLGLTNLGVVLCDIGNRDEARIHAEEAYGIAQDYGLSGMLPRITELVRMVGGNGTGD